MNEEPSEELIQHVAAIMSSMGNEERSELAELLHISCEEFDVVVENWKASRQ
jgi:hypothetical protein